MKRLVILRIILGGILALICVPSLVYTLLSLRDVHLEDYRELYIVLWGVDLFLLASYFLLTRYVDSRKKQIGALSPCDKLGMEGNTVIRWLCLGLLVIAIYWLYMGADFLHTGLSPVNFYESTLTESDKEGWLAAGFLTVYLTCAALSVALVWFIRTSVYLRAEKRRLRNGQ